MRPYRILAPLGATLGLALVAAGCGGGSGSPQVASLSGGGSNTATSAGAPADSPPSASSGGGLTLKTQNGLEFSRCMRSHGVANFPDPNSQGVIAIGPSSGIDASSAKFQAAQQACQQLIGGGKAPSVNPAQLAKARRQALAFSACMRRHSLPDFPDPDFSNGGIGIHIRAKSGGDLDPHSPTFQTAMRTCQGFLPGKLGAGRATAHAGA